MPKKTVNGSVEPFAEAYLILWRATPIHGPQKFTPYLANLLQIPQGIRTPPQKPVLMRARMINVFILFAPLVYMRFHNGKSGSEKRTRS
jgi:hypothetical protein